MKSAQVNWSDQSLPIIKLHAVVIVSAFRVQQEKFSRYRETKPKQAGRRLVRSLLTICDIGVSLHLWPMWIISK